VPDPRTAPLYSKVERVLAEEIQSGALAVGDRLPTETQLIERFAVSRITVRRAIQNLAARGDWSRCAGDAARSSPDPRSRSRSPS
jgi:GntR family transcriptional regulator